MKLVIKTLHGLEDCLAEEIEALGGQKIKKLRRAVSCDGNLAFVYSANYNLRTALRVLLPIHSFLAKNEQTFYEGVRSFDWSTHLELRQTFAIDNAITRDASIANSQFASLKMKDAIVDYFRDKTGKRPSINKDNPDLLLNLHGYKDQYTISVDSSGRILNQRGYRKVAGHHAPLNEVLAAGLLKIARWDASIPLLDPMCGSGTIALEAAMLARGLPAQILRNDFGFMNWTNFNAILWNRVKMESRAKSSQTRLKIVASDIDQKNIKLVKGSAKQLALGQGFDIFKYDFLKLLPPESGKGMIISNPPYGERIGGEGMVKFYRLIGDKLKHNFDGWNAWLLSSNFEALRALRLRPSSKEILFNGPLECQFCKYELYAANGAGEGADPDLQLGSP